MTEPCTCAACEALKENPPRFVNVGSLEETMNHHLETVAADWGIPVDEMLAILMASRNGLTAEGKALITKSLTALKERGGKLPIMAELLRRKP
jgi:hypothetical protein